MKNKTLTMKPRIKKKRNKLSSFNDFCTLNRLLVTLTFGVPYGADRETALSGTSTLAFFVQCPNCSDTRLIH